MPAGNGTPTTERIFMVDRRTFVGLGLAASVSALARAAGTTATADPVDAPPTLPLATATEESPVIDAGVSPPTYGDSDVQRRHPLEFRIDDSFRPDLSDASARTLVDGVLAFLDDEHPNGLTMTFWDLHPSRMPFLRRHLELTVEAVFEGVTETRLRRPVDPLLVLTVLYNESRFHPKVVSPAGAVGMAQIMPETATELGLAPLAHQDAWERYRAVRSVYRAERAAKIRGYRAAHGVRVFGADPAISRAIETGDLAVLTAYREIADTPDPSKDAMREYVEALEATFAQYEFFWDGREALGAIDARVGYGAVRAAVRYLARTLGTWQGLANTAVAAYNAGPGAVRAAGPNSILHRFGDIPTYGETIRYVQRFAAVYSALKYRLYRVEQEQPT